MKYEEVVLIGGPCDGRRMSVMAGIPTVQVAVPMSAPTRMSDLNAAPAVQTCVHPVYHRQTVHGSTGFAGAVYVADGVDAMAALIDGYRQPK